MMMLLSLLSLFTLARCASCFIPRIIGGQNASIANYPYQVSIIHNNNFQCGGSIISSDWMLTAAHCVYGLPPQQLKIRIGSSFYNKDGTLIDGITNVLWPNEYNMITYDFDVAVIKFPKPITMSASVKPISLAKATSVVRPGQNAVVTGWGRLTENGPLSDKLQSLTVPIIDLKECKKTSDSVTDNMICAGYMAGGKDTCQGDSGGPLVLNGVQIGIVSWGRGCARPKYPGLYTRVSAVRSWINQKTKV
ncbi:trypsin-1-like [Ceratina calcarata]|uniref:Trypsin-1-like n=1 Tax=Ceratina calcarata TaxID=156304 RepID=A0AAJ7RX48_9HYME|nr:trypsin-1-like [Ceratina calcarata]